MKRLKKFKFVSIIFSDNSIEHLGAYQIEDETTFNNILKCAKSFIPVEKRHLKSKVVVYDDIENETKMFKHIPVPDPLLSMTDNDIAFLFAKYLRY